MPLNAPAVDEVVEADVIPTGKPSVEVYKDTDTDIRAVYNKVRMMDEQPEMTC